MKLLLFTAALITVCEAALFVNAPKGRGCRYPNWKCDCKIVYRCDGTSGFPDDLSDPAGCAKDLAPNDYQLRIPGKRWRRNIWSQEEYCKQECHDRMNAFLCLDDEDTTPYSYLAICLKLLSLGEDSPFSVTGNSQPCCEIYLQWGLNWCPDKWHRLVTTTRCLTRQLDESFNTNTPRDTFSVVFSAETGCSAGEEDFTWCASAPVCEAPVP